MHCETGILRIRGDPRGQDRRRVMIARNVRPAIDRGFLRKRTQLLARPSFLFGIGDFVHRFNLILRVEDFVQNIDDKVDDHEGQGDDQGDSHDPVEIVGDDGVGPEPGDPRPGEDLLHHESAPQHQGNEEPDGGQGGGEGVAQHVLVADDRLVHPSGFADVDVILGDLIDHVGPDEPGDVGQGAEVRESQRADDVEQAVLERPGNSRSAGCPGEKIG